MVSLIEADGREDVWQVVSDAPTSLTTFEEYGWRFHIKEGFKDDKSGAFLCALC